jgi:hypothetical protein
VVAGRLGSGWRDVLKELRQALADTIAEAMPEARVLPYPPLAINIPASGVFAYVQPDPSQYVGAWRSFSTGGMGEVRLNVVFVTADTENAERDIDRIDDLIDPLSTASNVFGAVQADPTLGVTAFEVTATPLLDDVGAGQREIRGDGDMQITVYELILPVRVLVKRS